MEHSKYTKTLLHMMKPIVDELSDRALKATGFSKELVFVVRSRKLNYLFLRYAIIYVLKVDFNIRPYHIAMLLNCNHATILNALFKAYYVSRSYKAYRDIKGMVHREALEMLNEDKIIRRRQRIFKYLREQNRFHGRQNDSNAELDVELREQRGGLHLLQGQDFTRH